MYSVLIAEKDTLKAIQENELFFGQYLKNSEVAFCEWDPAVQNPADAVDNLARIVSKHSRWRAVVICGKENIRAANPFDVVSYRENPEEKLIRRKEDTYSDYLKAREEYFLRRREARLDAYRRGAQGPLARLMTYLCEAPMVGEGPNRAAQRAGKTLEQLDSLRDAKAKVDALDLLFSDVRSEYDEFAEYQAEARFREHLRQEILEGVIRNFTLPAEVICITRRCWQDDQGSLASMWQPHTEAEYSSFYKYNLYFDRMKYLICDVLPEYHVKYPQSDLEFLYCALMVACYELPRGSMQPNRVYRLSCEPNPNELTRVLSEYHGKLSVTVDQLLQTVASNGPVAKDTLSDRDCESRFQSQVNIQMPGMESFDMSSLYLDCRSLGMAWDCPENETNKWRRENRKTQEAMARYLKRPDRSLRLAAEDMRVLSDIDVSEAPKMNAFQRENLARFVDDAEMGMAATQFAHLDDVETYRKRFDKPGRQIEEANGTRMPRKPAVILGLSLMGIYLLGFLPFLFENIPTVEALTGALLICLGAAGALFAAMLLRLVFLRLRHKDTWRGYNDTMHGVVDEVERYLDSYSQYLSHTCAAIRGHRVLNYVNHYDEPYTAKNRILKKHIAQLMERRCQIEDLFGCLIDPSLGKNAEAFDYDFSRPVTYPYPLPGSGKAEHQMEFIQTGETVNVPILLIKSMKIVREELYD